jgi:hypothetical protein
MRKLAPVTGREFTVALPLSYILRPNASGELEGELYGNTRALPWPTQEALAQTFSLGVASMVRQPDRPVRDLLPRT